MQISNLSTSVTAQNDIVKFVAGAGNDFLHTPTTGSNLGAVIMTPDTGRIIALFNMALYVVIMLTMSGMM